MPRSRHVAALTVGLAGGFALGLVVWTQQTQRSRRDLFSERPWRRMAALGYLRSQDSVRNIRLLRDYVAWERHPGLRRRGKAVLRRMEQSLE